MEMRIGTSGWHYAHWKGPFYPKDLPAGRFLEYYVRRFDTVEINNSFYRLPQKETLKRWREDTPEGFLFTAKASRYITHMKKLKMPEEALQTFFETIRCLDRKLGPVLFQLPPRWRLNEDRLKEFLSLLPRDFRYAFEFRNPTWFDEKTYKALSAKNAAFCMYDIEGRRSPKMVTADFVYVRLHGPAAEAYRGSYDSSVLAEWAGAFRKWMEQGIDIFCYFDNDEAGYAVGDALRLKTMSAQ